MSAMCYNGLDEFAQSRKQMNGVMGTNERFSLAALVEIVMEVERTEGVTPEDQLIFFRKLTEMKERYIPFHPNHNTNMIMVNANARSIAMVEENRIAKLPRNQRKAAFKEYKRRKESGKIFESMEAQWATIGSVCFFVFSDLKCVFLFFQT